MTEQNKLNDALNQALAEGYINPDKNIIIHYLEIQLHLLNLDHAALSDPDRKDLTRALKNLKSGRTYLSNRQNESSEPPSEPNWWIPGKII